MADASEEFRRVFTGALEEESGLELAAETGDGQETVRLAKELSPDIVVMDFVLARMDGLEVLSELAALPGRPRVLVLSSFARGNMAELAAAHGADYYMMKPCKLSAVMERIRQLAGQPQSGGEEPVVTTTRYPTYRGALVVCQGGDQASVRLAVTEAVTALTGLPADRVSVAKWQ